MAKAPTDNGAQKMVPADCVSVLLMALSTTSISKAQYEMMSALSSAPSPPELKSSRHALIKERNSSLSRPLPSAVCVQIASFYSLHFPDRIGGGASGTSSPATPRKRKNSDGETTPAKKRATPKKKQAATPPSDDDDDNDDLSQNMQDFSTYTVLGDKADANKMGTVKNEEKWESGYA
jgi:hypothetical protein